MAFLHVSSSEGDVASVPLQHKSQNCSLLVHNVSQRIILPYIKVSHHQNMGLFETFIPHIKDFFINKLLTKIRMGAGKYVLRLPK